jgi:hypothetical protein
MGNILTITGGDAQIVGSGRATITLPMGTQVTIRECIIVSQLDSYLNKL